MTREEIIKQVDEKVKKELDGKISPNMLGYIHIFEKRKKEILKNEYGIEFKTLRERDTGRSMD